MDFSAPQTEVLQFLPPWLVSTWKASAADDEAREVQKKKKKKQKK